MNKEKFWQTIESVNRLVPDGDHEMVQEQMHKELLRYSPQDILDWDLILREYENAAYRNDLWAACTALMSSAAIPSPLFLKDTIPPKKYEMRVRLINGVYA